MALLPSGRYIVKSVSSGKYIGRALAEDKSLLPKRVVLRAGDVNINPPVVSSSSLAKQEISLPPTVQV